MCVDFVHVRMVLWNTLENGEDSDENVYGIPMLFIANFIPSFPDMFQLAPNSAD